MSKSSSAPVTPRTTNRRDEFVNITADSQIADTLGSQGSAILSDRIESGKNNRFVRPLSAHDETI
jgi:hypothetical protein